jgi:dihydroorotate dehydrogenase
MDPPAESQTNALGFPSKGLTAAAQELSRARIGMRGVPIAASISGTSVDDVATCHRTLEPLVDAVELNISSPNTAGLRVFHGAVELAKLLNELNEDRAKPLIVKLPPYPEEDGPEAEDVLSLARVCRAAGVDGLTAANSRPTDDPRLAAGRGGLSGRPIYERMLNLVQDLRSEVGAGMDINACGGIFTGGQAQEAIAAGATTVQIHTAIVYRGPSAARSIKAEMLEQREPARWLPAHRRPELVGGDVAAAQHEGDLLSR